MSEQATNYVLQLAVEELDAALDEYRQASSRVERASARVMVEGVRSKHPTARHLALEHSDQGDWWEAHEVLGADGAYLDEVDPDDDWYVALSNLDSHNFYPFITQDHPSPWVLDLDGAMRFADEEG